MYERIKNTTFWITKPLQGPQYASKINQSEACKFDQSEPANSTNQKPANWTNQKPSCQKVLSRDRNLTNEKPTCQNVLAWDRNLTNEKLSRQKLMAIYISRALRHSAYSFIMEPKAANPFHRKKKAGVTCPFIQSFVDVRVGPEPDPEMYTPFSEMWASYQAFIL